jgi:diketogulonate reductase-like aldo/keto reductase
LVSEELTLLLLQRRVLVKEEESLSRAVPPETTTLAFHSSKSAGMSTVYRSTCHWLALERGSTMTRLPINHCAKPFPLESPLSIRLLVTRIKRVLAGPFAIVGSHKANRDKIYFVMTKIPGGLTHQQALGAHHQNMFALNLDYVDHLMTHYPADWDETPAASNQARRQEEWQALEEIYYSGKARSIGISHYCTRHIEDIMEIATVTPSINQVEYHVGSGDVDHVLATCHQYNITFMSFSPLCGPCQYENVTRDSLIHGELVTEIGAKHGVSGAQVSLRFIVQQALEPTSDDSSVSMGAVIPKSNQMEHIRSNMDLFSFQLDDDDMHRLHQATKPNAEGGDCDVP